MNADNPVPTEFISTYCHRKLLDPSGRTWLGETDPVTVIAEPDVFLEVLPQMGRFEPGVDPTQEVEVFHNTIIVRVVGFSDHTTQFRNRFFLSISEDVRNHLSPKLVYKHSFKRIDVRALVEEPECRWNQ